MAVQLVDTPFDPGAELNAFAKRAEGAGAIVSFTGHVRSQAKGDIVTCLTLQAHPSLTFAGMEAALSQAKARWHLIDCEIIHRHGEMAPAEAIVFVATASVHRRAAFEAADFLMDYLKTKAVFWKKETGSAGHRWIEPRAEDYADAVRWD